MVPLPSDSSGKSKCIIPLSPSAVFGNSKSTVTYSISTGTVLWLRFILPGCALESVTPPFKNGPILMASC